MLPAYCPESQVTAVLIVDKVVTDIVSPYRRTVYKLCAEFPR